MGKLSSHRCFYGPDHPVFNLSTIKKTRDGGINAQGLLRETKIITTRLRHSHPITRRGTTLTKTLAKTSTTRNGHPLSRKLRSKHKRNRTLQNLSKVEIFPVPGEGGTCLASIKARRRPHHLDGGSCETKGTVVPGRRSADVTRESQDTDVEAVRRTPVDFRGRFALVGACTIKKITMLDSPLFPYELFHVSF